MEKQKIMQKCEEIEKEIDTLKEEQSALNIKKERLEIKQETKLIIRGEVSTYVDLESDQKDMELLDQLRLELNAIE